LSISSRLFIAATLLLLMFSGVYFLTVEQEPPRLVTAPGKPTATPLTVTQKKAQFKKLLIPAVDHAYDKLMTQYKEAYRLIEEKGDSKKLQRLRKEHNVDSNEALLMRLKPHPKSIALAQAAMESSWATSRFFKEANNVFGIWSFNPNEPRIKAFEKRAGRTIWVRKYASINEAVFDYYKILARGSAFVEFRKLKMITNDPYLLVEKLDKYSEKGAEYGKELSSIIRFNKFDRHDS
jgi:Bax protein